MLNHKNIIKLISAFVVKNEVVIIMEYADGGELLDYVEEKGGLDEIESRSIIKQVILAIDDCH
jgi:MAP/microtubule affinity-regulating kinase